MLRGHRVCTSGKEWCHKSFQTLDPHHRIQAAVPRELPLTCGRADGPLSIPALNFSMAEHLYWCCLSNSVVLTLNIASAPSSCCTIIACLQHFAQTWSSHCCPAPLSAAAPPCVPLIRQPASEPSHPVFTSSSLCHPYSGGHRTWLSNLVMFDITSMTMILNVRMGMNEECLVDDSFPQQLLHWLHLQQPWTYSRTMHFHSVIMKENSK